MILPRLPEKLLLTVFSVLLFSCGPKLRPVLFPVQGTEQMLRGLSSAAAEGRLDFSRPKKFEYRFDAAVAVPPPASLEISYSLSGEGRPLLETGTDSWILPQGGDFGDNAFDGVMHYVIPIRHYFPHRFSIVMAEKNRAGKNAVSQMQIHAIAFTVRWYGFYLRQESSGVHIHASPFVTRQGESSDDSAWLIDPPDAIGIPAGFFPEFSAELSPGKAAAVDAGIRRFEGSPHPDRLNIPAGMIAPNEKPLVLSGDRFASFRLVYAAIPLFPDPITADPGMALAWPLEHWRDRRYEVFRWESFPSLLIFDTADYAAQDRLFKRLAFFVEKAGFRGRLAGDAEIAELHGWNAHDYRAEDLARFFQAAREARFPLLAEERELERILFNAGIIRESGTEIRGGEGGIISISRESADYLRFRFMAHEGFHGLFFIDEDFRDFSRRRWRQLPAEARRFMVSYFNYQRYDTADEYLLINEFMAHILQQPVSQAGVYFGKTLPSRIEENSWRREQLPEKDQDSGAWPALADAFTREAAAFSAYVNSRWGLAAGRVHLVTVRQPER